MSSSPEQPQPVVLIGCGAVAQQFYFPALRSLESAGRLRVHALVDPSPAARAAGQALFPSAPGLPEADGVTAGAGALAIVASPPRFHAAQTIAALARGWHVLCEKPMALTIAEAESMVAAAQLHQRHLAIGLYKRFFPSSQYLRALCRDQLLGPLQSFSITEGGPFRWPAASPSFFDKRQTNGGVVLDIGVHVFDLLSWWVPELALTGYADDAMGGLETNALAEFSAAGGATGRVHLSRDWATAQTYRFDFARGFASWKVNDANGLTVQLTGAPAALLADLVAPPTPAAGESPQLLPSNAQCFLAQLLNCVAAIAGREPLLVPAAEGLHSLRLIEACYARRTLLEQPWLSPAEASRARELAHSPP